MATSIKFALWLSIFTVAASIRYVSSSLSISESTPNPHTKTFIHDLQLQCPLAISLSSPIQIDGESLDKALRSSQINEYTAILFHASWCPFSIDVHPKFVSLSAMFPQIKHIMVEESSAMPSVFSRYGIHSLPSILIVNQTAGVRYHGPKDLHSLKRFYNRITGFEPAIDLTEYQTSGGQHVVKDPSFSKEGGSRREPYLALSVLFILVRAFLYFFPEIVSRTSRALWFAYIRRHLNLGIMFGESSHQLIGRVLHVIDVKRVLSKLKLCKTRNFQERARSARVWASSFTSSVSLGDTTSSATRPFPSSTDS